MKRKLIDAVDIQLWIVPANNSAIKEREVAKYYFPLRLPDQTKDKYMKYVKHAKFICMKPEDDGKWEIKDCRILKIGLDTLEEAISSEKLFSDYFSTTEAEMEMQAPAPKKCVRKKKKAIPKTMNNSDTDDDNREVTIVSNYNVRYATDTQDMFNLDQPNNILPFDYQLNSLFESEVGIAAPQPIQSDQNVLTLDGTLDNPSNEMFVTIQMPLSMNKAVNELADGSSEIEQQMEVTTNDTSNQQNGCSESSCCKGHQKILYKIDYFRKQICNEFGFLRQEVSSNNKLLLKLLNSSSPHRSEEQTKDNQNKQTEDIQGEPTQLNVVEIDIFNEKYKATFPIKDSQIIIDFNNSMKNDQKFADNLFSNLNQIKGENEIKTARKILKKLCDFRCLKDFTWQGTKKMKSFQELHLVVEMITKLLTAKYPECDALDILAKVVKQRTKSAKEAFANLQNRNENASPVQIQDLVQAADADVNNKNDSTTAENETTVSTENTVVNNGRDTVSSHLEYISEISSEKVQ